MSVAADHLGSVAQATNAAGAITLTKKYDAWGNHLEGATTAGWAYTGREWDPETGLYYYRARYYNAKAGRFVSEDPIGLYGSENYYAYVHNDPIERTDAFGLRDGKTGWDPRRYPWTTAAMAVQESQRAEPTGEQNGPQDAMRHCIWSCLMTRHSGEDAAAVAGWVREKFDVIW